jgi:hypothetical protein
MRRRIERRLACAVLLALLAPLARAQEWQLPDLMQALRLNQRHAARFVEHRYLSVLDRPLESSGELLFVPPARVEKHTLAPRPETLVVDGDELTLEQPHHRPLKVRLQEHPEVAAFVDSIRGTLAGDQGALERNYAVSLKGTAAQWHLALTPRHEDVARVVSAIRIAGAEGRIEALDFDFAGGDRSEMRITPAPDAAPAPTQAP